ncbi:MAG: iron-siderophore ABC transporter substrate-binding protein [Chloroflexota bacterium]
MKHLTPILLIITLFTLLVGCAVPIPASDATTTETASESETMTASTTITHALGEIEISGTPEKVVTLEWSYTEDLLALGLQPLAIADIEGYNNWVNIPIELSDEVIDVGKRQAPNLEKLAEIQPDLIIGPAFRIGEIYDELSAIAPTIAFDAYPTDESITQFTSVKDAFMTIANVLDRTAEGEAVLADMEAHFAAAQSQIEEAGKLGESFSLAQAFGDDTVSVRLFTDNAMGVEIMEQIGLENGWEDAEFQLYGFTTVGMETLPELGDLNFFYVVQDDNNVFQRDAIKPVWDSLEFVENENAYPLGGGTWLFGGPLSAKVLVDTVVEAMTGETVMVAAAADDDEAASEDNASEETAMECGDGMRLFESETIVSSVCVPETAKRIVTLEPFYSLQMSLELGLPIIASGTYAEEGGFPEAWSEEELAGIESIGQFEAPNLESIANIEPDLIIGDAWFQGENYDLLSKIAPTVLIESANWKAWFHDIAGAAGVPEQAGELFTEYNARVAEVNEKIRDVEVSFVRVVPGGFQLYRSAPNAYAPIAIMTETGVVRTEFETGTDDSSWERLDWEGITNLTGDVLIYVMGGADDDEGANALEAEVTENPIWQTLPAAQAGEAHRVNAQHWMSFGGMRSAYSVLDDIEALLTE